MEKWKLDSVFKNDQIFNEFIHPTDIGLIILKHKSIYEPIDRPIT